MPRSFFRLLSWYFRVAAVRRVSGWFLSRGSTRSIVPRPPTPNTLLRKRQQKEAIQSGDVCAYGGGTGTLVDFGPGELDLDSGIPRFILPLRRALSLVSTKPRDAIRASSRIFTGVRLTNTNEVCSVMFRNRRPRNWRGSRPWRGSRIGHRAEAGSEQDALYARLCGTKSIPLSDKKSTGTPFAALAFFLASGAQDRGPLRKVQHRGFLRPRILTAQQHLQFMKLDRVTNGAYDYAADPRGCHVWGGCFEISRRRRWNSALWRELGCRKWPKAFTSMRTMGRARAERLNSKSHGGVLRIKEGNRS